MIFLLLTSILIFAITSHWAVNHVGRIKHKTISQHIALTQKTQIVFGISGSIASLLASIVLFVSILPRYDANTLTYITSGILMAFFFLAAIIPQIEKTWRAKAHNIAAWGMCFIIPIFILQTLFWSLTEITWPIGLIAFIVECILLVLLFSMKKLRNEFLVFQIIYLSIFFIYLVLLTI